MGRLSSHLIHSALRSGVHIHGARWDSSPRAFHLTSHIPHSKPRFAFRVSHAQGSSPAHIPQPTFHATGVLSTVDMTQLDSVPSVPHDTRHSARNTDDSMPQIPYSTTRICNQHSGIALQSTQPRPLISPRTTHSTFTLQIPSPRRTFVTCTPYMHAAFHSSQH